MARKTWAEISAEVQEERITKKERKLLARTPGMMEYVIVRKVIPSDVASYLSRGWEIISHTQQTYASVERYSLRILRDELVKRFS